MAGKSYNDLDKVRFGLTGGILWAVFVLLIALFTRFFPFWGELIYECYGFLGYNPYTFIGVVLGVVYGFVDGFVLTFVFAWLYNKLK